LALFAAKRTPLLPDVPTAAEAGLGDIDLSAWIGLVAPAGTPAEIVEKLNREIERILRAPTGVAWADPQGLEAIGGSAASFAATIESDRSRWTGAVKKLGVAAR
ncbi:MAG: tripartite tricarboxylate transporter substrate binding protein, partial [Burkholderiales bacterium]|nr:tripartite tricarboxylate transporter substrate binding protein [Burkholderiales bacterium]